MLQCGMSWSRSKRRSECCEGAKNRTEQRSIWRKKSWKTACSSGRQKAKEVNAQKNGGKVKCTQCGRETTPSTQRTKGSKVNPRGAQGDHVYPRSKGGDGATVKDQRNIDIKCAECNLKKTDNHSLMAFYL